MVWKNADGPAQNTALAQGADSTMYWGKRTGNGQIDVWEVADGSNVATRRTKAVSTWAASGRGQSHCPVPDGTDPCQRANDKLNVAFVHDGKLGFAWNVAEGSGFPFPHVRMARFELPSVTLADEPDVWHPDYAWTYAAAGVSAAGHLGLSLYRIGGGAFPRARVALVDDVDTDIDSLNVHGVISSDAGTLDPTGAVTGRWGDYQAVRAYGNCAPTRSPGASTRSRAAASTRTPSTGSSGSVASATAAPTSSSATSSSCRRASRAASCCSWRRQRATSAPPPPPPRPRASTSPATRASPTTTCSSTRRPRSAAWSAGRARGWGSPQR